VAYDGQQPIVVVREMAVLYTVVYNSGQKNEYPPSEYTVGATVLGVLYHQVLNCGGKHDGAPTTTLGYLGSFKYS
jgi:hypothetical protein